MKTVNIVLLCMLGAALLSTVLCDSSGGPDYCCFDFFRFPVNKNLISKYYRSDARCPVAGVLLITQKGREICVDSNDLWVKNVMKFLDMKSF